MKLNNDVDKVNEISLALASARSFAYMMTTEDYNSFNHEIKASYAEGLENLLGRIKQDFDNCAFK